MKSHASSKEAPKKQQSSPRNSHEGDYAEKSTYTRFLVSNAEAGAIIGKGASTISELQSQSGARIQLSRNYELFPGTSDRIIMISGTVNNVINGVRLILEKLLNEFYHEEDDAEPRLKVELVVPNSSCGGIIGKGGATIKSFVKESQAGIWISRRDDNYAGISDRLVTVTGTIDKQMRAIHLIVSKLSEDSYYVRSMSTPFPYAGPGVLHIGVADEHIELVFGRGGRKMIETFSRARTKVSDRGDFISGTNRKVTITGSPGAIKVAEDMIMKKVGSILKS